MTDFEVLVFQLINIFIDISFVIFIEYLHIDKGYWNHKDKHNISKAVESIRQNL